MSFYRKRGSFTQYKHEREEQESIHLLIEELAKKLKRPPTGEEICRAMEPRRDGELRYELFEGPDGV